MAALPSGTRKTTKSSDVSGPTQNTRTSQKLNWRETFSHTGQHISVLLYSDRGGLDAVDASSTSFSVRDYQIARNSILWFPKWGLSKLLNIILTLKLCRMSKARRDRRGGGERESFNTRSVMQLYCWFCCKWLTTAYWSACCLNKKGEEGGMRREERRRETEDQQDKGLRNSTEKDGGTEQEGETWCWKLKGAWWEQMSWKATLKGKSYTLCQTKIDSK